MGQQPHRRVKLVEEDVFAAQVTSSMLLALTLEKIAPRQQVDQALQEVLHEQRDMYDNTERQRINVLRICTVLLDKAYAGQE